MRLPTDAYRRRRRDRAEFDPNLTLMFHSLTQLARYVGTLAASACRTWPVLRSAPGFAFGDSDARSALGAQRHGLQSPIYATDQCHLTNLYRTKESSGSVEGRPAQAFQSMLKTQASKQDPVVAPASRRPTKSQARPVSQGLTQALASTLAVGIAGHGTRSAHCPMNVCHAHIARRAATGASRRPRR